jgi:hypothetical protein
MALHNTFDDSSNASFQKLTDPASQIMADEPKKMSEEEYKQKYNEFLAREAKKNEAKEKQEKLDRALSKIEDAQKELNNHLSFVYLTPRKPEFFNATDEEKRKPELDKTTVILRGNLFECIDTYLNLGGSLDDACLTGSKELTASKKYNEERDDEVFVFYHRPTGILSTASYLSYVCFDEERGAHAGSAPSMTLASKA